MLEGDNQELRLEMGTSSSATVQPIACLLNHVSLIIVFCSNMANKRRGVGDSPIEFSCGICTYEKDQQFKKTIDTVLFGTKAAHDLQQELRVRVCTYVAMQKHICKISAKEDGRETGVTQNVKWRLFILMNVTPKAFKLG